MAGESDNHEQRALEWLRRAEDQRQSQAREKEEARRHQNLVTEVLLNAYTTGDHPLLALLAYRPKEWERVQAERAVQAEAAARQIVEKVWRCERDGHHVFPRYLLPRCPMCGASCQESPISYDEYRRIVRMLLAGEQAPNREHRRLPPPAADRTLLEKVTTDAGRYLGNQDFVGYGNLLLDVLLTGTEEEQATVVGTFLAAETPKAVEHLFGLPPGLAYGQPHRDEHLPYELRNAWKEQAFPQLIIFAYVLGATRRTLPRPHDQLLPYYELMARLQKDILHETAKEIGTAARKSGVRKILSSDFPAEVKLNEIGEVLGKKPLTGGPPPGVHDL